MIFIPRSKIVLDCFTYSESAFDLFPISSATKHLPEWWKNSSRKYEADHYYKPTLKTCTGLIEYYKTGLVLPLWSDINFDISPNEHLKWSSPNPTVEIDSHPTQEWANYINPNEYAHLKIFSPWLFKTKSDIKWAFSNLYWNFKPFDNISIPHGVVSYKYQHYTHINMFIPTTRKKKFILAAGNPLAHIVPLTEKEVIIKTHRISKEEYNNRSQYLISFMGSYKKRKAIQENKEKSKCPFGF